MAVSRSTFSNRRRLTGRIAFEALETRRLMSGGPPSVISSSFDVESRSVHVTFTYDVRDSLDWFDLELSNLTNGQNGLPNGVWSSYDPETDTTAVRFDLETGWLTDGNHTATIRANSVRNQWNIPLTEDHTINFHVLSADVNRDRHVNINDENVIAGNMGLVGVGYANGDVNYDGVVSALDMAVFTAARNQWLTPQGSVFMGGYDEIRLKNESASLLEMDLTFQTTRMVHRLFRGAVSSLSFETSSGDDLLVLNLSNGNPSPPGGINFNGIGGNDAIYVVGAQNAPDTVTYSGGGISFAPGSASVSHADVETLVFDGRGGYDDLTVEEGTSLTLSTTQWLNSLNVGGIVVSPSDPILGLAMVTRSLSLSASAKLELNDNDLILDYTGSSPLDAVRSLINSAREGGTWTGNGITSYSARLSNNTTLGAIEASDFKSVYGSDAGFDSQAIDETAVLVKYTYYGDTDFSGAIDGDDYARIDNGFNAGGAGWFGGDSDDDDAVTGDDYSLIDFAFNTQSETL
jgi:hypothetical protein